MRTPGCGSVKTLRALSLCSTLILATNTSVWAAAKTWSSSGSGKWETPSNWSPAATPNLADQISIVNTNSMTVTIDSVTATGFPNSLDIASLAVSGASGSTNTLFLAGFGTNTPLAVGGLIRVGTLSNSTGMIILSNAAMNVSGVPTVGYAAGAEGTIVVQDRSVAKFIASTTFGSAATARGALFVLGNSSVYTYYTVYIGNVAGGTGAVYVGSGSQIAFLNAPTVGDDGVGLVVISNGCTVSTSLVNSDMTLGNNAVINGDVVIDLDKVAATDGTLKAMANLTLAESSRLILLGSARTVKLTTYAGTLTGTFSPSSVLPQGYRLVYGPATNGTIAVTSKRGIAFSVR